MVLPELVRLLSWTSANILSAIDSSGKISNKFYFAIKLIILSRDPANWWLTHLSRIYYSFTWVRSTRVRSKCQYFTGPRQFRKKRQKFYRDYRDNLVPRFGQLMDHAFCWEFAIVLTNANHYPSQCFIVSWLITSSSTPNLRLVTGPVLPYDLFYAWIRLEYQGSWSSPGSRLRSIELSDDKIDQTTHFTTGKLDDR